MGKKSHGPTMGTKTVLDVLNLKHLVLLPSSDSNQTLENEKKIAHLQQEKMHPKQLHEETQL